ncbi:MAG: DsbA family oxidoreductase [Rhodoferax sp.]
MMRPHVKVDFVSDVVCPWCAIGLGSLLLAVQEVDEELRADIRVQPFELNPDMPAQGQPVDEYLRGKYGMDDVQLAQSRRTLRQRGAEVGFDFRLELRLRTYNTFDAHRLLQWAGTQVDRQLALKQRLQRAYFTEGLDIGSPAVLRRLCEEVGLDGVQARQVLERGRYAKEVRAIERYYHQRGIRSVPAVVINDRHLISGAQPVQVYAQALRRIAQLEPQQAPVVASVSRPSPL